MVYQYNYHNSRYYPLYIIYYPVFHLKHDFSQTGFCLRFQVEHAQLCPIDRAILCLWILATTPTFLEIQGVESVHSRWWLFVVLALLILLYLLISCWCPETETSSICLAQLSRFHLMTDTESSLQTVEF
jgi:hypothetical protein